MSAQLKKQCTEFYEKINEIDDEEEKLEVTITWAKNLVKNALKKSEKVKKVKIPGAPPKGTNAFMIFCEEKRVEYKEENPDATTGEITKMIAEQWNEHRDEKDDIFEEYNQKLADRKEAYKAFLEENGIEEESKGSKKSNKPTRAPSAYNMFMKEQQPIVKEENPDAGQKEIMKIIGGKWSELSADEKAEYKPKDAAAPKEVAKKGKGKEVAKGKATDSEDEEVPKKGKGKDKEVVKGKATDSKDKEVVKGKATDSKDKEVVKGKATDSKDKEVAKKSKEAPKKAKIIVEESDEE